MLTGLFVLKATLILLLALVLDACLRQRAVLACTAMWNAVLLGLIFLPVTVLLLPPIKLPLLATTQASPTAASTSGSSRGLDEGASPLSAPLADPLPSPAEPRITVTSPELEKRSEPPSEIYRRRSHLRLSWPLALAMLYAVGVTACVLRLVIGLAAVRAMITTSQPVPPGNWQDSLACWQNRLGCSRVQLRQSSHVEVPLTAGLFQPVILLPQRMVGEMSEGARDGVIVHELAHVLRGDYGWQLLLRLTQAVLWFHPLIWLAERRIYFARERACDEFSVHALGNSDRYVEILLDIASRVSDRTNLGLGLAFVRARHIVARLEALAGSRGANRYQLPARARASLTCVCLVLCGLLGSLSIARAQQPATEQAKPRAENDTAKEGGAFQKPVPPPSYPSAPPAPQDSKAGKAPAPTENSQEETIAVSGTVVDESGAPVANANVSVRYLSKTIASVVSAADSGFIVNVPRRSFDGVLLLAKDERGDRQGTLVYPDQAAGDAQAVRIVLRKACKLEVTVTDDMGQLVTGARVCAVYRQEPMAEQMTDEGGRVVLRIPADVKLLIYAVKRDVGLDYARLTLKPDEQLNLVLRKTVPVRVRVVDDREQPVAGAKVYPVSVGRRNEAMMSFWLMEISEFHETTDQAGVATCHIPIDNIYHVPIQVEAESYARPAWVYWIPDDRVTGVRTGMQTPGFRTVSGDEFTVNLKPAVVVQGTVVHADGRPAAGAAVGTFGKGYANAQYVKGTKCDPDGAFKLEVPSGLYYVFNAQTMTERSRDQTRVIVADRPLPPLIIVLQPARRIHGTVTRGPDKTPVTWQHLSVYWRDDKSHNQRPPEEQLPNPSNDPAPIVLGITSNGRTDDQGRFEFLVPPGRYYLVSPDKVRNASSWQSDPSVLPQVDVLERSEVRLDLHLD